MLAASHPARKNFQQVKRTKPLDFSAHGGVWVPCAGSVTPWETHLGSEEYEPDAKDFYSGDGDTGSRVRDFLRYFERTRSLLDDDPTLWCISSWSDLGVAGVAADPRRLYRTSYFPGLGWMMRRELWDELRAKCRCEGGVSSGMPIASK